jgi:tRNA 2-thiouridine synthesizing protein A
MTPDKEIDARGLLCPLPVLKARKALLALAPGAVLCLLADDAIAIIDIPHFCSQTGHELLGMTEGKGFQTYLIRRAS